jgi:hypothetical protein
MRLAAAALSLLVAATAAAAPKRAAPPPMPKDTRRIDFGKLHKILNANDPKRGWIYASADGGCHVYPKDDTPRPPGSYPPAQEIDCPPEMLAVEWGWCTGAGTVQSNDKGDECICSPGEGDPPAPAFRMPCPGTSQKTKR